MRNTGIVLTILAAALFLGAPTAFAQRGGGHGGGTGGGMGGGMGAGHAGGMGGPPMGPPVNAGGSHGRSSEARPRMDRGARTGRIEQNTRLDSGDRISKRLSSHPQLASRLQSLLPAGTNLDQAAAGFKNFGQFVAAAHVSHNLNIPFDTLKARVTGPDSESLGKAIKELRPAVNAKSEEKKAKKEAKQDIEDSQES